MEQSTVYPIGNGKVLVYEDGVQIREMFGPSYSSPTFVRMSLCGEHQTKSVRDSKSASRRHYVTVNHQEAGVITDFTDVADAVFYRRISCTSDLEFVFRLDQGVSCSQTGTNNYLLEQKHSAVFNDMYPIDHPLYVAVRTDDRCWMYVGQPNSSPDDASYIIDSSSDIGQFWRYKSYREDFLVLQCPPGEHFIQVTFGDNWSDCDRIFDETQAETLYQGCLESWDHLLTPDKPCSLAKTSIDGFDIEYLQENTAVMLMCQQAHRASTISGYMHRMGYIRDQYGAFRGFLKLGYYTQAKDIIDFNSRIWQKHGVLHTAQAIGYDGIFHIHENDEAELTGYIIIEAFDYLKYTDDLQYVLSLCPMLQWALDTQISRLANNMLPFNGDETYIAGGLLPRSSIDDGSAETTMLFIVGGYKLVYFLHKHRIINDTQYHRYLSILQQVEADFASNFIQNNTFYANNITRQQAADMPVHRHGVCHHCHQFTWLQHTHTGNYHCAACFGNPGEPVLRNRYVLPAVSLNMVYIGGHRYMNHDILQQITTKVADQFIATGRIESSAASSLTVGYEYGLLLYALSYFHDDKAHTVAREVLKLLDRDGTWGEYYAGHQCVSARCRPWETGINTEAVMFYVESMQSQEVS